MRHLLCVFAALSLTVNACSAATTQHEKPNHNAAEHAMPKPSTAHNWLQQMVGKWNTTTEATYEPGKPAVTTKGTEMVRSLGGFWVVDEVQGTMMQKPFHGLMTLGFDDSKKEYVGTWVDSATGKLWNYTGQVEGKTLTLESEGECPMNSGKVTRFKETVEIKSPDHRVFTSYMLGNDGKWITTMTSHAHRAAKK